MSDELKTAEGKRPYEPPRLTVISLRPEEAVLGHCKVAGGSGPSNSFGGCNFMLVQGCSSIGS